MKLFFSFLLLFSSFILLGCAQPKEKAGNCTALFPDGFKVECEVADTPQEIQAGLMHRQALDAGKGMLFVMPAGSTNAFWMKNTKVPLDIMFLDEDYSVVSVVSAEPCVKDPCELYYPAAPYSFVLEVNKGTAAAHGAGERAKLLVSLS